MLVDFKLLQGEDDLNVFLGCSPELADRILHEADATLFLRHEIPKKGRMGTREVWEVRGDAVADIYKGLTRKLDVFIRAHLGEFPRPSVHGYVAKRGTLTNAMAHIGAKRVLKGDIRAFFRSIPEAKVVALFRKLGLSGQAAKVLARVVVRKNHLPLGVHTSPLLANAVCHDLDARLEALAPGACYTRYADDLSFSGPSIPTRSAVENELNVEGFELAGEKWRIARAGRGLYVTGLSLEDRTRPRVPRGMKRRLRQELHFARTRGLYAHLGWRGYPSLQSGVNKIDGLIRYVRGIEPTVGLALHAEWTAILARDGASVSYPEQGRVVPRRVLFLADESVIDGPSGPMMVVALVLVEDTSWVRNVLDEFLAKRALDPFGSTDKNHLSKKGIHWNDLAPDDRTKVTEAIRSLTFRAFFAYAELPAEDRRTYSAVYRRLIVKLIEGRLVRYDRCIVELVVEHNSKVSEASIEGSISAVYNGLRRAGSRRPANPPAVRFVPKLSDPALPLPDIVLGIFADYARSEIRSEEEASERKKRRSGKQADTRFEQIRDKIRAIFDLDTGKVYSRRGPFRPWPSRA